jgi:hypothetical protein
MKGKMSTPFSNQLGNLLLQLVQEGEVSFHEQQLRPGHTFLKSADEKVFPQQMRGLPS